MPLAVAAALGMTAPIYVSIFGVIFLKEAVSPGLGLAIALGIAGSLIIVFGGGSVGLNGSSDILAWAAAALAPATYAGAIVLLKHHSSDESAAAMTLAQSAVAAIIALPLAASNFGPIPSEIWPHIALIGLLGAVGFLLLIAGLRRVPASVFAVVDYTGLLGGGIWLSALCRNA